MFTNAESIYINGKEVQSIITSDGGVLYQNVIKPKGNLSFTGQTFTVQYSNGFSGSDIVIDWGDETTTTYVDKNSLNHTYAIEGDYEISLIGNITSFGNDCLGYCLGLTNVIIPDTVTSIGQYCFEHCSDLTSIVIPDSVTSIGNYCFKSCSSLTSIIIPDSVTSIGQSCFISCSSLTSIIIPDSVTSIGRNCFELCSNLTNIVIPDSVTSIEQFCFIDCSSLTSIIIPDSVTSIGQYCFRNCSSLTSIIIPNSVTSIGNYCFARCSSLGNIIFNWKTNIPTYNSSWFEGISVPQLSIPKGTTQLYVDKGYPIEKLTERISSLSLFSNKLSICSSTTAILTIALTPQEENKTIYLYKIIDNTNELIATLTTDSNGEATYSYVGTGAGETTFIAESGELESDPLSIYDTLVNLTVTSDKNILSYANRDTATITATLEVEGEPVSNSTIMVSKYPDFFDGTYFYIPFEKGEEDWEIYFSGVIQVLREDKTLYDSFSGTAHLFYRAEYESVSIAYYMQNSGGISNFPEKGFICLESLAQLGSISGFDIQRLSTDNSGTVSIIYESKGVGDVCFSVISMYDNNNMLYKTYELQDNS